MAYLHHTSGVQQGSVLGPVLFLLYINDLAIDIQSTVRLFADDCLMYRTIYTPSDHNILQQDLDTLSKWANKWLMKFNIGKCSILQLSKCQTKSAYTYSILGQSLAVIDQHAYLGVQLDHCLFWSPQVKYVCNKAKKILGFLQRNSRHCSRSLRELSYKQFVLPILDYCATIWDPYYQTDINQIEMLQHRAARFVLHKPWRRTT